KPEEQEIVIDVMKEEGLPNSQIVPLVKKARQLKETGPISKKALIAAIRDVERRLNEVRKILNLKRFHWELGPGTLQKLLETQELRRALDHEGISYLAFAEDAQGPRCLS